MISWPPPGTRVTVRYRRAEGSVPPLTDAVGHLLEVDPVVRVRTKSGAVAEFAPGDAVALRVLTDAPVRTSDIRALEHAAAAAWPCVERTWLDGWLLRAAHGAGLAANSALPLDISATSAAVPSIVDWYGRRGLVPRLAIPDRLLPRPPGVADEHTELVLVRKIATTDHPADPDPAVSLSGRPDDAWLAAYGCGVPVEVLTAVTDGEVVFGTLSGGAGARAAVTAAPDGARWVGLSAVQATDERNAVLLCAALLAWGAGRGATNAYLCVDEPGSALAGSLGFWLHHRRRYFPVRARPWDSV